MDAIASQFQSGALARAFQSFRQDAGDTAVGHRRRPQPAEIAGASRATHGRRDCGEDKACASEASGPQSASMAALSYRRAEGTSLFIKTREGDTVELKIRSRESLAVVAAQVQDGDQTSSAVLQKSSSSTRISLEVKGDLNEEEMAAIRSVVEQADALARQFFDNDLAGAFAAAENLDMDGAQLASVGFSLSLREQLTYAEKSPVRPANAPAAGNELPGSAPALAGATASDAASPVAAPSTDAQTPTAPTPAPASAGDAPPTASAAPDTRAAVDPLGSIRQFLSQLMEQMSAPASGTQLDMSLKIRIFQSVVTTAAAARPAAEEAAPPLPALVPDTLEALAAQQEPPLHARA